MARIIPEVSPSMQLEREWQDLGVTRFSANPLSHENASSRSYISALQVATREDIRGVVDELLKNAA